MATARVVGATSYAPPEKRDVRSADGALVLHVDPETKTHVVASARDPATPLWSFVHDVGFGDMLVANDGTVAYVAWRFVRVDDLDEDAVVLWNARGKLAAYAYRDLVARPPRLRGPGPIGAFWREWRRDVAIDDGTLRIRTTGPRDIEVDLATGDIDRRISLRGALFAAGALLALAVAGLLAAFGVRRDRVTSVLAPAAAATWLAIDLAGIPVVAAEASDWIQMTVWIAALASVPISLVAAARLPRGSRWVYVCLAVIALGLIVPWRIAC